MGGINEVFSLCPTFMKSMNAKTNFVLLLICIAFFIIGARVLHLGVVQRDYRIKEAHKPKFRNLVIQANRGEICDRFNIPLATNRICYNASIYYSQINQIPSTGWSLDESGKKRRTYPRREHIKNLSNILGKELDLDAEKIEDLIHAKASLLPHIPFVLKTNLEETQYYRLKMLEKDWPGLQAEIGSERYYPLGKVGCHVIGTLGSISQKQYTAIAEEIHSLQKIVYDAETQGSLFTLPDPYRSIEEVYQRLEELKDKAYTLNDRVGKSGIEGQFEEQLRGSWGFKTLEVDNQGKPFRELSDSKAPIAGNKIVLSISSELQQFAEELLIQSEKDRDHKSAWIDPVTKQRKEQKQPWMKGGSIVAIDPLSGEILALASYPRFNPNDFAANKKTTNAIRWLENERMIGALWDGTEVLTRERPSLKNTKKIIEESTVVSWEFYLDQILPKEGPLRHFFEHKDSIESFIQIQEDLLSVLYFSEITDPQLLMDSITKKNTSLWEYIRGCEDARTYLQRLESALDGISSSQDRLFAIDLCKLCIYPPRFSDELLSKIGPMKIGTYRLLNQMFCRLTNEQKEKAFKTFHEQEFKIWKQEHQKEFLTQKRSEEKAKKSYAKPYIDYLDKQEKKLFSEYMEKHGREILLNAIEQLPEENLLKKEVTALPQSLREELIGSFRFFDELDLPLFTKHPTIKTEKQLAAAFYPTQHFGYNRSFAFQTGVPLGSIFKLVTAYEGLRQGHHFTLFDEQRMEILPNGEKKLIVAYSENKTPFPRLYKGGRLPKSAASQIGKIDIVGALEQTSNPYFAILAGDFLKNPEDLVEAAQRFGYGKKTGVELPGEYGGNLPSDLSKNRTGLYSFAIGQHTFLNTPLQSALMISCLANGGSLLKPQILKTSKEPEIKHNLLLPPSIRNPLFEGMDRCAWGAKGTARPSSIKSLLSNPVAMHEHLQLQHQMIGKTSTAQILFNLDKSPSSKPQMYTHTWFGSIAFPPDNLAQSPTVRQSPELVVVVFLRFGDSGKEGAPIAAQMIRKWREIKAKHQVGGKDF